MRKLLIYTCTARSWLIIIMSTISVCRSFLASHRRNTRSPLFFSTKLNYNNQGFRFHNLTDTERVYCISDLHTDHAENYQFLLDQQQNNNLLSPTDLLIVAGDISHQLTSTFRSSLRILRSRCRVMFVPGNHEAWITTEDRANGITDSIQKLRACYDVCREEDVYVDPVWIGNADCLDSSSLWILPLESWYDGSLSFSEELCEGFEYWPWVDFAKCDWPPEFPPANNSSLAKMPLGLVDFFLQRNTERILQPWQNYCEQNQQLAHQSELITVSHFLPNQQCLPDWKDVAATSFSTSEWLDHGAGSTSAKFAKVAGSDLLDTQLRSYRPQLHIFGHSHRPKDIVVGCIRYLHHPLGKPRERAWQMIAPEVTYQCVWEQGILSAQTTVIRYWEEYGGGVEALRDRLAEEKLKRAARRRRVRE